MIRRLVLQVIGIGVLLGLTGCTYSPTYAISAPCPSDAPRCGNECCALYCVHGECRNCPSGAVECSAGGDCCALPGMCVDGVCRMPACKGWAESCDDTTPCCTGLSCLPVHDAGGALFHLCCASVSKIVSNGFHVEQCDGPK
jgi:hypothetical protein